MNIDYLRNFVVIVDSKSILAASKKLFIAQPSLSNQVKYLENEYKSVLLIRGGREVRLTEAGKVVYSKAKSILNLLDSSFKEVNQLQKGMLGTLSIAIPPTVYSDLINKNFLFFTKKYPGIHLDIYEMNSLLAEKALVDGRVEIAITNATIEEHEKVEEYIISKEAFKVFILENNSPLSVKREITIKELKGHLLTIPRAYVDTIIEECLKEGFKPNIIAVTTTSLGAIEMAKLKECLAIAPMPDDEYILDSLLFKTLKTSKVTVYIRKALVMRDREKSYAAKLFLDCLSNKGNND